MWVYKLALGFALACLSVGILQAQDDIVPRFEEESCDYDLPAGVDSTCGYVVVPANRLAPTEETFRLAVTIFHSYSDNPAPDPVVSLTGGPGGMTVAYLPFSFRQNYRAFLDNRDFIMFDQRGVGFSDPQLDCENLWGDGYEAGTRLRSAQQIATDDLMAMLDCQTDLVERGIDLTTYTTQQNAADLADLRIALGYDEWNLFGVSYGTKLALTTMRDHPEGIRSVILDSVYPLQANLYTERAANQQRAFDLLFEYCAADADCTEAYPNLEKVFYDLVERMNTEPVLVDTDYGGFSVYVTGDMVASSVFGMLYVKSLIPVIPLMIDNLARGDENELRMLAQDIYDRPIGLSEGMYYSIQCGEEVRFANLDTVLATSENLHPMLQNDFTVASRSLYDLCDLWGAYPAAAAEDEPVQSDIPTLVLSGEFDPITPPSWGAMVADDLSSSFYYVFPSTGHGTIRTDSCAQSIALQFIESPTTEPDSACIEAIEPPNFEAP